MDEQKEIRVVDLFAGIGGFHLGLEKANGSSSRQLQPYSGEERNPKEAPNGYSSLSTGSTRSHSGKLYSGGFRCVWANEWDKYAASIYRKRFPETPLSTDDIRKVNADDIPDHDLLCAGFPCQAFSVAGKRRGFEEARGTLFFEIARIAERKRPHLLLLENVKGLLSHDEGRTFWAILRILGELGYWCEWQVLNSKWFGVPQNRERVFIVGHIGGEPTRTVFPITEIGRGSSEVRGNGEGKGLGIQTANTLSTRYGKDGKENLIAGTLSGGEHSGGLHSQMTLIQVGNIYENKADAGRIYSTEGVARTLKGESGGLGGKMGLYQVQPLKFLNRNQKNFDDTAMTVDTVNSTGIRVMGKDYSNALNSSGYLRSGGHHPESHRGAFAECRIRRLTPVECERLQGFPDGWTEGISDTQRYKCLGNAVTVPVIRFLKERIIAVGMEELKEAEKK